MALPDRAAGILSILEAEKELRTGELYFVCHSKGGLLVEYILLKAAEKSHRSEISAGIVKRTRKVVYMGTPHRGSVISDWISRFPLASKATVSLRTDDPHLRSLNQSSREIFVQQQIQCLTFTETKRTKLFFRVVTQDSGDPGYLGDVIPVDEDHVSICKPRDRDAHVYRALLNFLETPSNVLEYNVARSLDVRSGPLVEIQQLVQRAHETIVGNPIVDDEVERQIQLIRRGRFFTGAKTKALTEKLLNDLNAGILSASSSIVKARGLAFCARMLCADEASRKLCWSILGDAERYGADLDEIKIAHACLIAGDGNVDGALATLSAVDNLISRGVAFRLIITHRGMQAAKDWLARAGLREQDLDAESKSSLLQADLAAMDWDAALIRVDALSEEELEDAPILLTQAANTYVAQLVPEENRAFIIEQIPLEAAEFSLSADRKREWDRAVEMLRRSVASLNALGLNDAANANEDFALWLDLRSSDRAVAEHARSILADSIRSDRKTLLRRLHLVISFRLPFDFGSVKEQIDRETALSGGKSFEAALARLALMFAIRAPNDAAEYLMLHRAQISQILSERAILSFEIQLRARAGQTESAADLLKKLKLTGIGKDEEQKLDSVIQEASGADPVEMRRRSFEETGGIVDLSNLVAALELVGDTNGLIPYADELFNRTKDVRDGERLVAAYVAIKDYQAILDFFAENPSYESLSPQLICSRAWALREAGNLVEAKSILEPLLNGANRAIRDLHVEIGVASGDWEALTTFVEAEWSERSKRSAEELLRGAELAFRLNLQRAKPLAIAAAEMGSDNPLILSGCYFLAAKAGWERDPETSSWLPRAAALSKDKGPIQRFSIREFLEMKPEWDARQHETWQQMLKGEMPLFAAALGSNRALSSLTLLNAIANISERDVRKRGAIFAFAGSRKITDITAKVVAMDVTSAFNLSFLGLLGEALAHFDKVILPYGTFTWLWNEAGRVAFHQPNRIRDAEALALLSARRAVEQFDPTIALDPLLASEIGDDLAEMLAHAKADLGQVSVVRSGPIHQVGSLMEVEADIKDHRYLLSGCKDVIDALLKGGRITTEAAASALSYIALHEQTWGRGDPLVLGQKLYLDDLTVSTFQHLQILELVAANFHCIVPKIGSRLSENLLEYQGLTNSVAKHLADVREILRQGVEGGKVVVGPRGVEPLADDERLNRSEPTIELLTLPSAVEAILVDDRSINRFPEVSDEHASVPTCTTLDLLQTLRSSKAISLQQHRESITKLRQAGYLFIPVEAEELAEHLAASQIYDTRRESAELRAIRESVVKARTMNALQPGEIYWLESLSQSALSLACAQLLISDTPEGLTRADYLWDMVGAGGWAHNFRGDPLAFSQLYRQQILLLIISAARGGISGAKIRVWLDEILVGLKAVNPALYTEVVLMAEQLIYNYAKSETEADSA